MFQKTLYENISEYQRLEPKNYLLRETGYLLCKGIDIIEQRIIEAIELNTNYKQVNYRVII